MQPIDPTAAGPELADELLAWCVTRLARYKCPRRLEFTNALPRSETGKLFKRQLRARLLEQH